MQASPVIHVQPVCSVELVIQNPDNGLSATLTAAQCKGQRLAYSLKMNFDNVSPVDRLGALLDTVMDVLATMPDSGTPGDVIKMFNNRKN